MTAASPEVRITWFFWGLFTAIFAALFIGLGILGSLVFLIVGLAVLLVSVVLMLSASPTPLYSAYSVRVPTSPGTEERALRAPAPTPTPTKCQYCGFRSPAGESYCLRCTRPLSWSNVA